MATALSLEDAKKQLAAGDTIHAHAEGMMSELMVVGFHGKHRAAEVLEQLQRLDG